MNKIVGLVGEDSNDTLSIRNLLLQRYSGNVSYIELVKCKKGDQLKNNSAKAALKIECERKKPDIIIFIKDADGVATETLKINAAKEWFRSTSSVTTCSKILLLNIWELEALIFADIDTFNKIYRTSIKGNRNVTFIKNPKEELRKLTRDQKKYAESDCPGLFKQLNIDVVSKNCSYFKTFLDEFSSLVDENKNPYNN